jgi:HEPN domain-containing protein
MGLRAEVYRDAAREHVAVAAEMYEAGHYVLAHYISGLAVECILRGYQVRLDAEFNSKHDVRELAESAGFAQLFPERRAAEYATAMTLVYRRWHSDFRYRSAASLRSKLIRLKLHESVKGDLLKESARRIMVAATMLVKLGVAKWKP